jgi:hypothetical protein
MNHWIVATPADIANSHPVTSTPQPTVEAAPTAPSLDVHCETLELINEEASVTLDRQNDIGAKVDTKAIFLAGFASAAAQFLATQHKLSPILTGLALSMYGISFTFAVSSITLAKLQDIDPKQLFDRYGLKPKGEVLGALCAHKAVTFQKNYRVYKRKATFWRLSLLCLAAGMIFSVITLLGGS